jgi:chitinase
MRRTAVALVLLVVFAGGAAVAGSAQTTGTSATTTTVDVPTVPGAPTLTSAVASGKSISLNWTAPASNGGAAITGFEIYRSDGNGTRPLLAGVGLVDSYQDTAVTPGTTYSYWVSAVNSVGEGPLSNELSAIAGVQATAPGPPTLTSASAGSAGIAVAWSPPSSDGGASVTGYRVYRVAGGTGPTQIASLGVTTSYTDTDVVAGNTYSYDVTAVNSAGEGAASNALSATAVGPNTNLLFKPYQAIPVGSWPEAVAVGDVNGDGRNDVVMTTSYYFDPVNDFHLFVFLQAADGTLSAPISYATAATYTNRPESVAVGDITGDGRADVVVGIDGIGIQVFPQLAGGTLGQPAMYASADTNKIRLGQLNGDGRLDVAGVGWGTNTIGVLLNDGHGGLSAPVSYPVLHGGYDDLEIADVTGDGRDDLVVMSGQLYADPNVSVLAQLPGGGFGSATPYVVAPNTNTQGIGVGDVNGDGRNDVVASYGGNRPSSAIGVLAQGAGGTLAGVQSYPSYDIPEPVDIADVDLDGRPDVVVLHGGWLEAGIYRQLANGTLAPEDLYAIPYASHYNPHGLALGDINGDGSPDIVLADYNNGLVVLRNATSPSNAPAAPTLKAAISAPGSVSLTWDAPSSLGGSPSGYRVYRGTASGGETLLATLGSTGTYTDSTVASGQTYYYEIAALNSLGEGPRSNERSATTASAPGAPQLISATPGNAQVSLAWTAPSSNGGAAVTGYDVYRTSGGAGSLLATLGNVTSFTDATAVNGQTYSYSVSAVNAAGEGVRSNALSATPRTIPGAPTLTSARGVSNGVALAWSPPGSNGGATITAYRIYRGTTSSGETLLTNVANVTAYTDTTVANGKTYYYRVSAVNAAGEGPSSNELSAKRGH